MRRAFGLTLPMLDLAHDTAPLAVAREYDLHKSCGSVAGVPLHHVSNLRLVGEIYRPSTET